jgi:hypothetical protein
MKERLILFLIGTLFFLLSCTTEKEKLDVRVTATSNSDGFIEFRVYPENEFGNIVTGASVSVREMNNAVTYLDFSNNNQCYLGFVESSDKEFTVRVKSILFDKTQEYKIPHYSFTEKPVILQFSDSTGNNVLSGDILNSSKEIQVSWKNLGENVVYSVNIKTSLNNVYSSSTEARTVNIPPNTLNQNSTYFITLTAQRIFGDVDFEKEKYYSVSKTSGSSVAFYTE